MKLKIMWNQREERRFTQVLTVACSLTVPGTGPCEISNHGATNNAKGTFGWAIHVADQLKWTGDGITLGQQMAKLLNLDCTGRSCER
jgi:hypothetical protein